MNWYKESQYSPISIVSYDSYGELGISFNGGKKYIYHNIPVYLYEKIKKLLEKKNYRAAEKILKNLSSSPQKIARTLYHGTSINNYDSIKNIGIKKGLIETDKRSDKI